MKKILLLLVVLVSSVTFAQNNGITYQAVIYSTTGESVPGIKNSNAPLSNKPICLQFSIVDDNSSTEYQEKMTVTTDDYGMVNLVIGNGTQTGGYANSFNAVVWSNPNKYLKVSVDQTGNCSSFELISDQILTYVPFALAANSAASVSGVVGIANGGTNATTVIGAKTNLQLQNVDNTSDLNKPLSTATQSALNIKVDKVTGKELSSNDYTTAEKTKLAAITGTNTGDQDLSLLASTASVALKANTADVVTGLATKVDKVTDKDLSTNDYTTVEKNKLAAISGVNTGDQDLSSFATTTTVALKANSADVTTGLASKVDKVTGKELSSNDYTTVEKTKLAAITGTNTGDQDLSSYATTTSITLKANSADVTTGLATKVDKVTGKELSSNDYTTVEKTKLEAITGTNTGDQDLSLYASTASVALKANTADVTSDLANKVDKVTGKELSSNDYTTVEKTKLAAITGTNTGDQDLSLYATTTSVALKANTADVTSDLANKVDKITGKELSSNDYTTVEKTKLAAITGTNTGDQDLSLLASTASVALKANTADVTNELATKVDKVTGKELSSNDYTTVEKTKLAAITGTNTGDQDLSLYATNTALIAKENTSNKSSDITLSDATNTKYPTELAVKTFVENKLLNTTAVATQSVEGAIWITPTTGTLNGVSFVLSNSQSSSTSVWDLSNSDFSAAPLSVTQNLTDIAVSDDWTITFASPITNLRLYSKYWRAADYTFDNAFSILSGSGLSSNGNILTVNGWGNGIIQFSSPITSLSLNSSEGSNNQSGQIMTFGGEFTTPLNSGSGEVARLISPIFSGIPTALTATPGTSTTQLATTAFVTNATTGKFVDLTTNQTIAGNKTFSSDIIVNGITAGKGNGAISSNTTFGLQALKENTSGINNTAFGLNALNINTTGYSNTATGLASLASNSTGSENTANGAASLAQNSTGSQNTANGVNALYYNTTGNNNTANGLAALEGNTSGYDNTANGSRSLFSNRTGYNNTATGSNSLKLNTFGYGNTANGVSSLQTNVTGNENTAIGNNSLFKNISGSSNTANGGNSLYSNTTGVVNTANGANSLYSNTLGYGNTATGYNSLSANTVGFHNTAIGNEANVGSGDLENATAIGNGAIVLADDTIQLGNTAVTNVKTSGTITAGAITYPNTHGTTGQVLTTNSTGSLMWSSPASVDTSNFVDVTSDQTIAGSKTFGQRSFFSQGATFNGRLDGYLDRLDLNFYGIGRLRHDGFMFDIRAYYTTIQSTLDLYGNMYVNGQVVMQQDLNVSGTLTSNGKMVMSTLTIESSDLNNYDVSNVSILFVKPDINETQIFGLQGGTTGQVIHIYSMNNVNGNAGSIVFFNYNNDGNNSNDGNQKFIAEGNITIGYNKNTTLVFDGTYWRVSKFGM